MHKKLDKIMEAGAGSDNGEYARLRPLKVFALGLRHGLEMSSPRET